MSTGAGRTGRIIVASTCVVVRDRPLGSRCYCSNERRVAPAVARRCPGASSPPFERLRPGPTGWARPEPARCVRRSRSPASRSIASHSSRDNTWLPPGETPRRFRTWFFLAIAADGASVEIDGREIISYAWLSPRAALERHAMGVVSLMPPTWVALRRLRQYASVVEAVSAHRHTGEQFECRLATDKRGAVLLRLGDEEHPDTHGLLDESLFRRHTRGLRRSSQRPEGRWVSGGRSMPRADVELPPRGSTPARA
jgi:hypothetical protein